MSSTLMTTPVHSLDALASFEAGETIKGERRASPLVLPVVCASVGMALGFYRGGRMASLRFLAENAHRAPKTIKGWYLYNKTKNYRIMYGGLKGGAKDAVKLGAIGSGWVATEAFCEWLGDSVRAVHPVLYGKEVIAGGVTGAFYATWNRLGLRGGRRMVMLGFASGGVVRILREVQKAVE